MKNLSLRLAIFAIILVIAGCSAYKELEPEPELSPAERGYIELKNDDDLFEMDQGKKYFIRFPKPLMNNFYLVLSIDQKNQLDYYFSDRFDDGEGEIQKIKDEAPAGENISVFAIGSQPESYYWIVENVSGDIKLKMDYRYVPMWRYRFENRYASYQKILKDNIVSRSKYNAIDVNYNLSSINFIREIEIVKSSISNIRSMQNELIDLETIFPPNIATSRDTAYQNYTELRGRVDDELSFQENYLEVLNTFYQENVSFGNIGKFLGDTDDFINFLSKADRFPARILSKAKALFAGRLADAYNYYFDILRSKNDTEPIETDPPISKVYQLYSMSQGTVPAEFESITNYVMSFNGEVEALNEVDRLMTDIEAEFAREGSWPSNSFYPSALEKLNRIVPQIPESRAGSIYEFRNLRCSALLDRKIANVRNNIRFLQNGYREARFLVPEINNYKAAREYKQIIKLLNQNKSLGFLVKQYPDLDNLSLNRQKNVIDDFIKTRRWSNAEINLRRLNDDEEFVSLYAIRNKKAEIVRNFEDQIHRAVRDESRARVDAFTAKHENTYLNVEALYKDSVFTPVYRLNFSSKGYADLEKKRNEISNYLNKMKHHDFPEKAIQSLWKGFVRDFGKNGVDRARAIVVHGSYYKGKSKSIKQIVDQCDPNTPKWITKTREYRSFYVMPTTTNKDGSNEYVFKLMLKIPTEARFPVYDINIKLPEEIAENAAEAKWYDIMTINNKEIKNEGRIKITAPTPANDYEFQVSPVQMDKDRVNVLEVKFTFPAYKVFQISTMAQPPLIKKN